MVMNAYDGVPRRIQASMCMLYRFLLPAILLKTFSKSPYMSRLVPMTLPKVS